MKCGTSPFRAKGVLIWYWALAWIFIITGLASAVEQPSGGAATAHRIRVAPSLAPAVVAEGGALIADYGSFQIFDVPQLSPVLAASDLVELQDDCRHIKLNAGQLDTSRPEIQALRQRLGGFSGKRLHLLQFVGPLRPEWHEQLAATGVSIVAYIPENTFLIYGDASSLAGVQSLAATAPHIQWDGAYLDDYKIHPTARLFDRHGKARDIGTDMFAVQLVADAEANTATLQVLDGLKLEPFRRQDSVLNYQNVIVRLSPASLAQIAAQPDVVSIHPYFTRKKLCERQDQIVAGNLSGNVPTGPGYLAWLAGKGFTQQQFTTSGFSVDVSDSGIDNATTAPNHFGLYIAGNLTNASRVIYNRLEGSPNSPSTLQGCDGHGNLNAHIIGGYDNLSGFPFTDSSGFHYGLGVCPFVRLGSSVIFDSDTFTFPSYTKLQADAYNNGARISNNSWGSDNGGAYDPDAQSYDSLVRDAQQSGSSFPVAGNQEMVIVFAAGNAGPDSQSVGSPGTAKNVITVGGAENVQAIGGPDINSGVDDTGADNANDMTDFSSRGPCADGRLKPDFSAPSTHVSGGVPQAPNPATNGTANSCFSGDGVSGGTTTPFFPDGQQFYTASDGTSHSTPCVAGGCALLRQYFLNNFTNPPSPAMTKAYLMNSTRYLTGAYGSDTLPSSVQGMGEMNLGTAFDGTPRVLRDELPADLFTASGQTRTFTARVAATNKPVRITLAWTDAPGSTAGAAYNNNLDLTAVIAGQLYKGNVFSGQFSVTGGSADTKNNTENIFLPAGTSGTIAVTITAANLNSDGVPNNANSVDQDFALVIYNATPVSLPVLNGVSATVAAESFSPTNGAVDPGETVTLNLALQNSGTANTTNLVATLLSGGGVTAPGAPQNYGALVAGGLAVSRPFTLTATGSCGGSITATLNLTDGTNNLGQVAFNVPLGLTISSNVLVQNFDAITPPGLPAGWAIANSGSGISWTTDNSASDTAPNSAFGSEPDTPGVEELISPSFAITYPVAQLQFHHNYDLEADDTDSSLAYDGGVLEIKIGGGSFTDILSAGGSFVSNGYNRTIDPTDDNPLDGRQVWSGASGSFVTTLVNLPPAVAGQTVQLKWRVAMDSGNFFGGSGWHIDTISVQQSHTICASPTSAPTLTSIHTTNGAVSFSFLTVASQSYTVQYKDSLSVTNWTTLQSLTGNGLTVSITNSPSSNQRYYRVRTP